MKTILLGMHDDEGKSDPACSQKKTRQHQRNYKNLFLAQFIYLQVIEIIFPHEFQ